MLQCIVQYTRFGMQHHARLNTMAHSLSTRHKPPSQGVKALHKNMAAVARTQTAGNDPHLLAIPATRWLVPLTTVPHHQRLKLAAVLPSMLRRSQGLLHTRAGSILTLAQFFLCSNVLHERTAQQTLASPKYVLSWQP